MNRNEDTGPDVERFDDEIAAYDDAVVFAQLLESSSLGTPAAHAARAAGLGAVDRHRRSWDQNPEGSTAPDHSDLAQFIAEHFDSRGESDTADLWYVAALLTDADLPRSTPAAAVVPGSQTSSEKSDATTTTTGDQPTPPRPVSVFGRLAAPCARLGSRRGHSDALDTRYRTMRWGMVAVAASLCILFALQGIQAHTEASQPQAAATAATAAPPPVAIGPDPEPTSPSNGNGVSVTIIGSSVGRSVSDPDRICVVMTRNHAGYEVISRGDTRERLDCSQLPYVSGTNAPDVRPESATSSW